VSVELEQVLLQNGSINYVHQFIHANIESTVYMTSATLPVRYQITNEGTTNGDGTLKMICATVISEGGYESLGIPYSIGHGHDEGIDVNATIVPLIGLRLKSDKIFVVLFKLFGSSILTTSNGNLIYYIYHYLSPATDPLTGGTWTDVSTMSYVQYNLNATGINLSGAIIRNQGFFNLNNYRF